MLLFENPHLDGDIQKIGLAVATQRGSRYVRFGIRFLLVMVIRILWQFALRMTPDND